MLPHGFHLSVSNLSHASLLRSSVFASVSALHSPAECAASLSLSLSLSAVPGRRLVVMVRLPRSQLTAANSELSAPLPVGARRCVMARSGPRVSRQARSPDQSRVRLGRRTGRVDQSRVWRWLPSLCERGQACGCCAGSSFGMSACAARRSPQARPYTEESRACEDATNCARADSDVLVR